MVMWGLMDHTNRSMEDSVLEAVFSCGALAQVVSEEKNFIMWLIDCACYILLKNVAEFCSCLKSLPEAKVKRL